MRSDPGTCARTSSGATREGMSNKEICCCLKRYLGLELSPLILADFADSAHNGCET
ncbi:hypothetical protein QFZ94_007657 [Paraburkholderia sp. JPY465]